MSNQQQQQLATPTDVSRRIGELGQSKTKSITLADNGWFADSVGCFVQGASYLLGGAPGSRKSGLATQVVLDLALQGQRVVIVPTEEPYERVWQRIFRMADGRSGEEVDSVMRNLHVERVAPSVEQLPHYVSTQILSPSGQYHGAGFIVIDSVQGHGLASAATRTYDRVLEATRLLSSAGVTSLLINHLTKKNELAGPRTLEHGVDCVLMLRKTPACRLLFVSKNRHGPASLRDPVALVLDPLSLRLTPTPLALAATSSAKTYLGPGAGGAIDVQASVGLAGYGTRGRVTAPGLPKAELQQLVATIGQLPDIEIDDLDFSIHCRLPGRRRYTSCIGIALAIALLSSYLRRPVPPNCLFLGEVDLGRGLRPFDDQLLSDLISDLAANPHMARPWRIYCHPMTAGALPTGGGITAIGCERLDSVMYGVWPDLR